MTVDKERMARSAGLLFGVGGMFAAVALFLPHPDGSNGPGIAAVALTAVVTAVVLATAPADPFPEWSFSALMFAGTALISIAMYYWRPGPVANSVALLYVWVLLYAWYWFSTRLAVAHTVMAGASFAVVLASQSGNHAAATQWMVTIGTATVAGVLIGWLVHQVQAVADTDPLTRLPNRRAWEQVLDRELGRAARNRSALSVAIADLDDFKVVNDTGGHQAGDALLRDLAAAWRPEVRSGDFLARYGGDEFGFVLLGGEQQAVEAVGRVLASFPAQRCTAGIASWDGTESRDDLIRRADLDLYRRKLNGRAPALDGEASSSDQTLSAATTTGRLARRARRRLSSHRRDAIPESSETSPVEGPRVVPQEPPGLNVTRPRRVLVIDDDAAFRRLVRMLLADDPSVQVLEAVDGYDGVAMARTHQPDVVLLDLAMPSVGGLQALPLIVTAAPRTLVVVLSAMEASEFAQQTRDQGAVSFLAKDSDLTRLNDYLEPLLSGKGRRGPAD